MIFTKILLQGCLAPGCLVLLVSAVQVAAQTSAQQTNRPQRVSVVSRGVPSGYLGVGVVEVDAEVAKSLGLKEERGVQVTKVDSDSPASRAGLKEGDIILEYNGQRVEGLVQFVRMVSETPVNRRVPLGLFRSGTTLSVNAVVGQKAAQDFAFSIEPPIMPLVPSAPMAPSIPEITMPDVPTGLLGWQSSALGYLSEPVDGQLAEFFGVKEGVLIRSVSKRSPADKAGLRAGDVIVEVEGHPVKSPREVTAMVRRNRVRKSVSLSIVRSHKELTLDLISWNRTGSGDVCC